MTQLLDAVEARLVAILESARGASGLGAAAAEVYIPAGRYRRAPDGSGVLDVPTEYADRCYQIEWQGRRHSTQPQNPLDGQQLRQLRFRLDVLFRYGVEAPQWVHTQGSEVAAASASAARKRALGESEQLERALTFPDLFQATDTTPALIDCMPDGDSTLSDAGGGRLVLSMPFLVWVSYDRAASIGP